MNKSIREKRNELRKKSVELRRLDGETKFGKNSDIRYQQTVAYNKWEFYDKFIKATERMGK